VLNETSDAVRQWLASKAIDSSRRPTGFLTTIQIMPDIFKAIDVEMTYRTTQMQSKVARYR
jgi:hypothetical protein